MQNPVCPLALSPRVIPPSSLLERVVQACRISFQQHKTDRLPLCSRRLMRNPAPRRNHLVAFLPGSGLKLHDALVNLVEPTLSSCKLFLVSTALKSLIDCCRSFQAPSVRL